MISQQRWRVAGGACLLLCIIMAVASLKLATPDISAWVMLVYWGIFLVLLLAAIYIAVLDFKYSQLKFKMTERELFKDTFMTPEFRQAIEDARKAEEQKSGTEDN